MGLSGGHDCVPRSENGAGTGRRFGRRSAAFGASSASGVTLASRRGRFDEPVATDEDEEEIRRAVREALVRDEHHEETAGRESGGEEEFLGLLSELEAAVELEAAAGARTEQRGGDDVGRRRRGSGARTEQRQRGATT